MDLRLTFNEDGKNYDLFRPRYCQELFDDIKVYSKIDDNSQLLEVGIGTGQATEPFLKNGSYVTAIELGDQLAKFSKEKFKSYEKFQIHNIPFEAYNYNPNSLNLVYSGTAFHWIPDHIGYKNAFEMLEPGGTLALFWNKPSGKEDDEVFMGIQKVFKKYGYPSLPTQSEIEEKYKQRIEKMKAYGFVDVELKLYYGKRTLNASEHISLMNTYSDHRVLPLETKLKLEKDIYDVINSLGDQLSIYDTMDLYLGRKPFESET